MNPSNDYQYLSTILSKNHSCISLNKQIAYYLRPQNRNEKRRRKSSYCSTEEILPKLQDKSSNSKQKPTTLSTQAKSTENQPTKSKIRIAFKPMIRLRNQFLNGNYPNEYSFNKYKDAVCNFCYLNLDNEYSKQQENHSTFSTITLEQVNYLSLKTIITICKHKFHYDCFQNNAKQQIEQKRTIIVCICGKKIPQNQLRLFASDIIYKKLFKTQMEEIFQKYENSLGLSQCNNCTNFWVKTKNQLNYPLCIYCVQQKTLEVISKLPQTKQKRLRSISMQ